MERVAENEMKYGRGYTVVPLSAIKGRRKTPVKQRDWIVTSDGSFK
jgi:hypothetical protein